MLIRMAVHRYAAAWLLLLESLEETQTDVSKLLELTLKAINQKSLKLFFLKKIFYTFPDTFCLEYNVHMHDLFKVGLNDSWVGWNYLREKNEPF